MLVNMYDSGHVPFDLIWNITRTGHLKYYNSVFTTVWMPLGVYVEIGRVDNDILGTLLHLNM
jgi:hypothetical protein